MDSTGHVLANMKLKGAALLMILSVKLVCHKKRAIKTESEKPTYYTLQNQPKPNNYMKNKIDKDGSFSTLNSHKEC